MRTFGLVLLVCSAFACDDWFDGWGDEGMWMDDWGDGDGSVRITELDYAVEIHEEMAAGTLEISFATRMDQAAGVYQFQLPAGAVIHGAELYLSGQDRWEPAETLGRRQGKEIYTEIVESARPKDPLFLQGVGPDLYEARVFPITVADGLKIRIHYAHMLGSAEANARLWVPLSHPAPDAARPFGLAVDQIHIEVRTAGETWTAGEWLGVEPTAIADGAELNDGHAHLTLHGDLQPRDIALELRPAVVRPTAFGLFYASPASTIPPHVWTSWLPDFSAHPSVAAGPRNVVFVVDLSGSMAGAKLELARSAVHAALAALAPEDAFGMVTFSSSAEALDPLMRAGAENSSAVPWVNDWRVGGGTNLAAGLALGTEVGATSPWTDLSIDLLLVTDGRPTVGQTTHEALLAELSETAAAVGRPVRLFACGLGADLDQQLLLELAAATGGEATFALDDGEIEPQILALFERVRSGGAADVRLALAGDGMDSAAEQSWPRVFPGTHLTGAGRGLASSVQLALAAATPEGELIQLAQTVTIPTDSPNRLAAPLAAKTWADQLERDIDLLGETDSRVAAAVLHAKTYGILTRYSSMLALETEQMYVDFGLDRLERDPAGIALSPPATTAVDESRIGGGMQENGEAPAPPAEVSAQPGTGCTAVVARRAWAWLGLLLWLRLGRRGRREARA